MDLIDGFLLTATCKAPIALRAFPTFFAPSRIQVGATTYLWSIVHLICNILSSPEVVLAFLLREEFACLCNGCEQRVEGAGLHAPQVRFEFGKCHFDGVPVWV